LQTLLLFLVPLLVATAPASLVAQSLPGGLRGILPGGTGQAAPQDPFDEAALLGWSASPPRMLVAEHNSPTRITLRVLHADGATAKLEIVDFAEPGDAPEFSASALRKWDRAKALMQSLDMSRGRSSDLDAERRGLFHTRYQGRTIRYLLTTPTGTQQVLEHDLDAVPILYPYFPPGCHCFALVGRLEVPDSPAQGVVVVRPLKKAKSLSEKELALIGAEDARNRVANDRLAEAGALLHLALQRKSLPELLYLAAIVDGYLGEWDGARTKLAQAILADPEYADRAEHEPLLREARLRGLDLNDDPKLQFKASKGYEGTSVWVKVKDASGRNIAIFKPTNGNTYARGEIFTYQMAKLLGTEKMYPVTMLHTLNKTGCDKFIAALEKVEYKGMKERNRTALMKRCARGQLEGAVKEWVVDFQFFQAIGTSDKLKKHRVFEFLNSRGARPPAKETIKARTVTKYYKPDNCKRGTYKGTLELGQLARDVSDLLIMDVLNANEDRFPGANVDFKSLGKAKEVSECVFDFGPSRLFSLDNGATFKGTYSNGYVDFTKRLKPTRFVRRTYDRLKALEAFINGKAPRPRFIAHFGIETVADLSKYVALDKGDSHKRRKEPFKLFTANLRSVLERLDRFADQERAWFK
jgi:hypothetical protein